MNGISFRKRDFNSFLFCLLYKLIADFFMCLYKFSGKSEYILEKLYWYYSIWMQIKKNLYKIKCLKYIAIGCIVIVKKIFETSIWFLTEENTGWKRRNSHWRIQFWRKNQRFLAIGFRISSNLEIKSQILSDNKAL